jgi:HlyD family secretion protein
MQTVLRVKQAQLKSTIEDWEAAKANAAQAKKDLAECTIQSTMDGVISRLYAEEGENVVLGTMNNPGTVIMTISDMNSIVVRARIDENYVPLVKPGQTARIYLQCDSNEVLTGTVKRVSPQGEKGNQTNTTAAANNTDPNELAKFETLITIENPPPMVRLGMTANVEIIVDERSNVLGIPPQAVLQRRSKDLPPELTAKALKDVVKKKGFEDPAKRWFQIVFVEKDGKALTRIVKTGVSDENRVEILNTDDASGLKAGDRVIVGPYRALEKLREGKAIKKFVETQDQTKK